MELWLVQNSLLATGYFPQTMSILSGATGDHLPESEHTTMSIFYRRLIVMDEFESSPNRSIERQPTATTFPFTNMTGVIPASQL